MREPKQKRSILMTEKILDTALKLFCEKGYYAVTTNEIAREAGISIGSLYSYFKDKDTIFLEILRQYHENFLSVFERIQGEISRSIYHEDQLEWLRILIEELIKLHQSVKTLNRELKSLYYIRNDVKMVMDDQTEKVRVAALKFFEENTGGGDSEDLEVIVLLIVDFISVIVDRIVFDTDLSDRDRERIVRVGVEAAARMLCVCE